MYKSKILWRSFEQQTVDLLPDNFPRCSLDQNQEQNIHCLGRYISLNTGKVEYWPFRAVEGEGIHFVLEFGHNMFQNRTCKNEK